MPIAHSGSFDAVIQQYEEIKTQEDPSQRMYSAQLLMDEIQYWQSRIEQNEAEIARLEETMGYQDVEN